MKCRLHPARTHPDQDEMLDRSVAFHDLVREACDRPPDGAAIEQNRCGFRHWSGTKKPSRPEPGGLSNE